MTLEPHGRQLGAAEVAAWHCLGQLSVTGSLSCCTVDIPTEPGKERAGAGQEPRALIPDPSSVFV